MFGWDVGVYGNDGAVGRGLDVSMGAVGAAVLAIWGQELGLFGATDKPFFARGFVGDKAADDACAGGGF